MGTSAKESKKYTPDFFFPSLVPEGGGGRESKTPEGMKERLKTFYPPTEKKEDKPDGK